MGSVVSIRDPETPNSTTSISKTAPIKGSHTLEIHGFSFTKGMGVGNSISSDTFFVGEHPWKIEFYPEGYEKVDESGDIYVSLYIAPVGKCEGEVEAYFEYVLFDQSGNKWQKQSDAKFAMGSKMTGPFTLKEGQMK